MKGVFFSTGETIPSSRYRVLQFLEHFRERGVDVRHHYGYGPEYNRVANGRAGAPYKLVCRLRRALLEVMGTHSDDDFVFFQRKAFREFVLPELVAMSRNSRVIFDFDDSIFLGPGGEFHPLRQRAFDVMCARSAHIICGNRWLAERAGHPEKTTVIPTVIDTSRWTPATEPDLSRPITIGWMGTASSFELVRPLIPALEEVLASYPDVRLRLVSNASASEFEGNPQVEQIRWSAERELELLRSFDVGIMPMIDNELTRGKCGFKMILYMSVGCPVVGSAVGANVEIVEGSGSGLLVEDEDGWAEALGHMIEDPEGRRAMGAAAREHVVANYSVDAVIDRYMEVFETVARGSR